MNMLKGIHGPLKDRPYMTRVLTRSLCALCVLVSILATAAGCSAVYDPTTTTASTEMSVTSTSADETTTTLRAETSTTATSTSTTSTVDSSTTTTILSTTTTVPPTDAREDTEIVLYEITDWSDGVSGWAAAGQWKTTGGMLVTDGTSDSFAVAPVDLTGYPDYVVECEAQIINPEAGTAVLLMARLINGVAYYGGFDGARSQMVVGYDTEQSGSAGFVLDSDWHKYRLEVRGNSIRLFLEQAEVARATDNHRLEPGTVGIYCGNGQINVRSFRVIAL